MAARTEEYVTRRPPILQATRTLGFPDADIGRVLRVTTAAVNQWASGLRPIPRVKHAALYFFVNLVLELISVMEPPSPQAARRIAVAWETASKWMKLAREELGDQPVDVWLAALAIMNEVFSGIVADKAVLADLEAKAASFDAEDEPDGPARGLKHMEAAKKWLIAATRKAKQRGESLTDAEIDEATSFLEEIRQLEKGLRGSAEPKEPVGTESTAEEQA